MTTQAMYVRDGDTFVGTELTQGGWNPGEAGGCCPLALIGHVLEDVPTLTPMTMARFTVDLMRPVPVGKALHVRTHVAREGKKLQIVDVVVEHDGLPCVRSSVLRLRDEDVSHHPGLPDDSTADQPASRLVRPDDAVSLRAIDRDPPPFLWSVDIRDAPSLDGTSNGVWIRIDSEVVAGEPVRDTSRMVVGFDFVSLIGIFGGVPESTSMINPDVSAQVLRRPVGEWVALTGETRFAHGAGRGVSMAHLSDELGVFGYAVASQLVQLR